MSYRQPNKLYLFYPTSLIGLIICLVTRSPYAHAAIEMGGVLYDASEHRGSFGRSDIDVTKRGHIWIEFSGDLSPWLMRLTGSKYDWLGVFGWLWKRNRPGRFYCFEAAWQALYEVGIVSGSQPARLSGSDLLEIAANHHRDQGRGSDLRQARFLVGRFGGGDTVRFLRLFDSVGALEVAREIRSIAMSVTNTTDMVETCLVLALNRDRVMRFEEELYAREVGLIELSKGAVGSDPPAPAVAA